MVSLTLIARKISTKNCSDVYHLCQTSTFKASCINNGMSGKITQNCIKITCLPISLHKLIFSYIMIFGEGLTTVIRVS